MDVQVWCNRFFPPESQCIQVVHIRACVEETGASKLSTANIAAYDPFEMAGNFGDFALDDVIDTRRRMKTLRVPYSRP
jgi:hypothetical protein